MIYSCENCGILFCRSGEIRTCPCCELNHIRIANTEEASRMKVLEEANIVTLETTA